MQRTYEPNSKGAWQQQPDFSEPPLATGGAAGHWDHRADDDYHTQPGNLFRLMTPEQQRLLCENTARSVGGASKEIQQRHIAHCTRADPAYGAGVAAALERGASEKTPDAVI
ncbi:catalase-related domain-containing protein [Sulfuriferula plumbiphila]|nr:catalase-related domain-containing protein [Sulfuriferula plumbiphila]